VLTSFNQPHQESKNWLRIAAAQVMHTLYVKVIHPQHVKGNMCIAQYDVMTFFFTITVVKRWTQISKIPLWIVVSDTVFKSCFTSLLLKCMVKVKWMKGMWGNYVRSLEKAGQCMSAHCYLYPPITWTVQVGNFCTSWMQSQLCTTRHHPSLHLK